MISAAIETVIGLVLIYFLLSLVCSGIEEFLAGRRRWRAKFLSENLQSLLGKDLAEALYNHPLMRALCPPEISAADPTDRPPPVEKRPSYIPSGTFSLALQSVLANLAPADGAQNQQLQQQILQGINQLPNATFQDALKNLMGDAGADLDRWRKNLEVWFDDAMERVSGWYKRDAKKGIMVLAAVVTLALNADTVVFATSLWEDPAIRETVAAQAQAATEPTDCPTPTEDEDPFECIAQRVRDVKALEVPIGWPVDDPTNPSERRFPHDTAGWALKVLGLLLTWAALTRGAPFWFDVLNRLGSLRSAGRPPREDGETT
jgi:hypothetical protein